jgi:preprotein translocase subunit SecD
LLLAAVLTLSGCTTERVGGPAPTTPSTSGPVDLPAPMELARVVEAVPGAPQTATTTPPSGTRLPGPDGEELTLEAPFLTIDRLEAASVQLQEYDGHWAVELELTRDDARTFGEWTRAHIGERAAVVADNELIFAPAIQSAIEGGEIEISGQYTEREARDLLAHITGR